MALVTHDCVFWSLGELALWLEVSLLQLGLELGDFLHVTFRDVLEADLVIALNNELFIRCLEVSLQILNVCV
jgi:hypothetical protein